MPTRLARWSACFCLLALLLAQHARGGDVSFEVTFDRAARDQPAAGRLVVYLVKQGSNVWQREPADGPFWEDPQPLFGKDVSDWKPGDPVVIGADTDFPDAYPHPPAELSPGKYKAQAVLDLGRVESVWSREPGNLSGEAVEFEVKADGPTRVTLSLTKAVEARPFRETEAIKEVSVESKLLSAFRGEPVTLRAGVLLPIDYDPAKQYAAVYTIPGFSGRHTEVHQYARWRSGPWGELRKRAFIIVLDPESPNGHTLFCDSRVNGPCARALIEELIPAVEARFPLVREPWARIVTGHSSGGWSSLWLGTQYPGTFGACWSTGPDPVDFRRLELIDIYGDANAYMTADGGERPAARFPGGRLGAGTYKVTMSLRDENGGEGVLGPNNTSGQQWDSWMACWGTPDPANEAVAKPLFDAKTGALDHAEAKAYEAYDIRLLLARDPERYVPLFAQNVRILCGELDNYYLNEAVSLLKEELARHDLPAGPGYVKLVPGADHGGSLFMRPEMTAVPGEMVEHLKAHME